MPRHTRGLVATAIVGISLFAASPASASGDYDVWRSNFGTTTTPAATGDLNGYGSVDAADYVIWR